MRRNVWSAITLVMILPVMLLTASCGNTKNVVQPQPVSTTEPEVQKVQEKSAGEAEQTPQVKEDKVWADVAEREAAETVLIKENIHFAVNSSALSDQAQQILLSKAEYLRTNPDITITVEGHCDDRGSDEYNMALGERRAESVKMFLTDLGIATNRLNIVSYGEERPIATGQDEASWARNRRAQFVIN